MQNKKKPRTENEMRWTTLESRSIIERPWMNARVERVLLPDGRIHEEYYILHYPKWVNIIAITEEGEMVMERQWRHGLGVVSTEIPAGVAEGGEEPLEAAQRELMEETGFGGGEWSLFMQLAPNASSMDNISYTFLARGVRHMGPTHFDSTEDIEVFLLPQEKVFEMLQQGQFIQATMVAPIWKYFATKRDKA